LTILGSPVDLAQKDGHFGSSLPEQSDLSFCSKLNSATSLKYAFSFFCSVVGTLRA